jgi:hypothetical protein
MKSAINPHSVMFLVNIFGVYISIVNAQNINGPIRLEFSPRLQPWVKNLCVLFVPTAEAVGYGSGGLSEPEDFAEATD